MKVLIINPYCYPEKSAGVLSEFLTPMPPIGLAYLVAAVEKAGLSALFYDDLVEKGDNIKLEKYLVEKQPDIIGLPIYTSPLVYRALEIFALARKILPRVTLVSGHLHANIFAEELLKNKTIDAVVTGEGEITLPNLTKAIEQGETWENLPGLIFFRNNQIIKTPPEPLIENLDELPFPAWHLMPFEKYNIQELGKIAETGTFVLASRGCPYNCSFCSLLIQGKKRRVRSAKNVCDEIEWLINKYKIKSFHFIDATFPFSKQEGLKICQEMIKRGINKKIVWGTETRTDIVDEELLTKMYEAGCRKILFGIESGSQKILQKISKKNTLDTTRKAVSLTQKAGISATGLFMIGLPEETTTDIQETINYALSLDLDMAKFSVFVPYPGTADYAELVKNKKINPADLQKWERYTSYPSLKNPPIYLNPEIKLEDLIKLQKQAHLRFYLRPKIIWRMIFKLNILSLRNIFRIMRYFISMILNK